jgi:hypothetical protein
VILVTSNKRQRLLCVSYVGKVVPTQLADARAELKMMAADLPAGFRLLADFGNLEFMDPECANEMGRTMEFLDGQSVSLIVRVIPDPQKDIGMNIISAFHYPHRPRVITCETLAQALKKLAA